MPKKKPVLKKEVKNLTKHQESYTAYYATCMEYEDGYVGDHTTEDVTITKNLESGQIQLDFSPVGRWRMPAEYIKYLQFCIDQIKKLPKGD